MDSMASSPSSGRGSTGRCRRSNRARTWSSVPGTSAAGLPQGLDRPGSLRFHKDRAVQPPANDPSSCTKNVLTQGQLSGISRTPQGPT
jgi:hypothetical protein